jgi:hypothetical protein
MRSLGKELDIETTTLFLSFIPKTLQHVAAEVQKLAYLHRVEDYLNFFDKLVSVLVIISSAFDT